MVPKAELMTVMMSGPSVRRQAFTKVEGMGSRVEVQ